MYRTGFVGRPTPCLVHGCTIRNESNGSVYVRVLYEPVTNERNEVFERRCEFQLQKSSQTNVEEAEFDKGSFQIRETIQAIEVTRSNGQVQKITAPFENVNSIELNWLFVIDNTNVRSVRPYN